MAAGAADRFRELFFSTGKIATGSVTEYYTNVSGGKISMEGEVVGPFRMPRKMKDYAHGASGFQNNVAEPNIRTLGGDALAAATGKIKLAPYDNDHNGYVDAFVVVHAGRGAETDRDPNKIWSVKWNIPSETTVDGVKVWAFLTIPEDAYIGVCCHELGHLVFGWPDLYDVDYSSEGIGNWCLMAGGSWGGSPAGTKPCHPSAWCKVSQGWVNLINETSNHSLSLQDVKDGHEVHRLWKDGDASSKEYFLIENRQQTGFDQYMPGNGLLVWHVDDNMPDNTNERHYKVALMQADGLNQLSTSSAGRGDPGDPFPGSTNNTSFNVASKPNSLDYNNQDSQVTITNISSSKEVMTMDVTVL
ncbi:immune inhibitor A peptidase M6-domain-containing protein, partial [Xylariales sp. PMI_506]